MYKVMQTCETGEVFCPRECATEDEAWDWINANERQYPESTFYVECPYDENLSYDDDDDIHEHDEERITYKVPLYRMIAMALSRMDHFQSPGAGQDKSRAEDIRLGLCRLIRAEFPSGSGFDAGTQMDIAGSNPNKLLFFVDYHHLGKDGAYEEWTKHKVIVDPSLLFGVEVRVMGRNKNSITEYIGDIFQSILNKEVDSGLIEDMYPE